MTRATLLSDELLRQLMAVGQVDVLVGLPTFNHAATAGSVVRQIHRAFVRHFPRERTVLVNLDTGSADGTPEIVSAAAPDESDSATTTTTLRTTHRITTPYHGLPGKAGAVRALLAAADLLQARALVVLDPEVTSVEPEWLEALARPVLRDGYDYVGPVYARTRFESPLVAQLVRPAVRAAYGCQVREPLGGEFGCSRALAAHLLAAPGWDEELLRVAVDLWVVTSAVAGGFRCAQAALGPRVTPAGPGRPGLTEVLQQVVGALFECLGRHQDFWHARSGSDPVPIVGAEPELAADGSFDASTFAASFHTGVRDLEPILSNILDDGTRAELQRLAASPDGAPGFGDELWVRTVWQFAAAHHRAVMNREHLTQALVPLYLGRVASFVGEHAGSDAATVQRALEDLALVYERTKPFLLERWDLQ